MPVRRVFCLGGSDRSDSQNGLDNTNDIKSGVAAFACDTEPVVGDDRA